MHLPHLPAFLFAVLLPTNSEPLPEESTELPEATTSIDSPTPAPVDTGPLPPAAWNALLERDITLVRRDGTTVTGRLVAAGDGTATVITSDGRVTSTLQADVTEVRAAELTKPSDAPPVGDQPPPTAGADGDPRVRNWARTGAAIGLSMTATTLTLAIGSEVTREDLIPSLPLGATATVLFAAAVPVIMAGGRSARRSGGVRGSMGLRVGAWILYGLTLTDAAILVGLGANEVTPPPGVITSVGLLAVASASLGAADALIADKQARRRHASVASRRLAVSIAPTSTGGAWNGAVAGVGGAF